MNDKELLELAAKAAGIELKWGTDETAYSNDIFPGYWRIWNPLRDDGDALRLAVKLGLDVCIDTLAEIGARTHVIGFFDTASSETVNAIEKYGDPYAATRRAIVRTAAEIGKKEKAC